MSDDVLLELAATIKSRRRSDAEKSYTKQLLDAGPGRCSKKFGEEACETIIAAMSEDDEALRGEAADVLYHLLVLLEARDIDISDVLEVLRGRMGTSGVVEKASRSANRQS